MKICLSAMVFPDIEDDIRKSKHPNTVSGHKFQMNLIKGLDGCMEEPITVINTPRIRAFPDYPKVIMKKKIWAHALEARDIHIGYINLFPLNIVTSTLSLYRELLLWVQENSDEDKIIFVFNGTLPQLISLYLIKKRYPRVILCGCVGDLHGRYGLSEERGLIGCLKEIYHYMTDTLLKTMDCYAFCTKYMADALKANQKPFVVIEGMYSENSSTVSELCDVSEEQRVIFYAGALSKDYGIFHLLNAFNKIQGDYNLLLAGSGDAVPIIKKYAEKDPRIKYLGFISPKDVEKVQKRAMVLVSPRTSELEFVKYSFPSKTMECLASGKPYIAHKLPCDPPEYANYIQYAENETDAALANKIIEICERSEEERDRIGKLTREFILKEKNPVTMTKRIVDMWKEIFKTK